jgi:hypothetical protein
MYPSKLVPYILRKKQTDTLTIYKFSVFLTNGGKGVLDLSQGENPEQTLAENGCPRRGSGLAHHKGSWQTPPKNLYPEQIGANL